MAKLRRKPYEEVTRARCRCCDAPAVESFTGELCAEGRGAFAAAFCAECDAMMNEVMLRILRVDDVDGLVSVYRRERGLPSSPGYHVTKCGRVCDNAGTYDTRT